MLANLPERDAAAACCRRRTHALSVESISVTVPGTQTMTLSGISFDVEAGTVLAVIGPSAAGKSTLARALTGVWPLARGAVRLDGAALASWSPEELGQHVGYLPQDVQLFDGTITENIARFEEQPDSQRVIAASRGRRRARDGAAAAERLRDAHRRSAARCCRPGSASASRWRARCTAIRSCWCWTSPTPTSMPTARWRWSRRSSGVKARGGIVVVIAHRPSLLSSADMVAVIGNGQLTAIGPRDEMLRKVLRHPASAPAALAIAADGSK